MDELEDLHTDWTNICFTTMEAEDEGWDPVKLASTPPSHYWPFQDGTFIVVLFANCYVVFHFLCVSAFNNYVKKVREKSRECHNHKPQPFPDPKRKRKPTNLNKHKPNKRTKSTKICSFFPKLGNRNTKKTEKHKNKMTHGKTYNKSPRRKKRQSNKE